MKIFISGELDFSDEVYDSYRQIRSNVEKKIQALMDKNNYGDAINLISIIPTIFSPKTFEALPYKERKYFSWKNKEADYRLRIDYDKFIKGDDLTKRNLILDNIIQSIRLLNKKVKKGFEGKKLENDIRNEFSYHENISQ